jgi:hypothetical protein
LSQEGATPRKGLSRRRLLQTGAAAGRGAAAAGFRGGIAWAAGRAETADRPLAPGRAATDDDLDPVLVNGFSVPDEERTRLRSVFTVVGGRIVHDVGVVG